MLNISIPNLFSFRNYFLFTESFNSIFLTVKKKNIHFEWYASLIIKIAKVIMFTAYFISKILWESKKDIESSNRAMYTTLLYIIIKPFNAQMTSKLFTHIYDILLLVFEAYVQFCLKTWSRVWFVVTQEINNVNGFYE